MPKPSDRMIFGNEPASSPDPLASQSLEHGPRPKTTPKKPLADTSNNVRRRGFCLTTPPHYANGNGTPFNLVAEAENPISPWRIRVTVQAEQNGGGDDFIFSRMAGGTATTKIPLKAVAHDAAPSIPKNGRGAPRKLSKSPVRRAVTTKQKRAVTAHKATPTSARGLVEKENNQENLSPTKRRRGRPRKSAESHAEELEPPSHKETAEIVNEFSRVEITSPRKSRLRSRGGSKAISPNTSDSGSVSRDGHRHYDDNAEPTEATEYLDGDSFRSHVLDPTSEHDEFDSILESEGFSMVSVSSLPSAKLRSDKFAEIDEYSYNQVSNLDGGSFAGGLKSNEKPESSTLNADSDIGHSRGNVGVQERGPLSPPYCPQELVADRRPTTDLTPLKISSATLIPPMIKAPNTSNSPRPLEKPSDGTPRIVRVVRAGIALQGVLSPRSKTGVDSAEKFFPLSSTPAKSPIERLDSFFSGFGAGTRRELRAGLRLGEQLAKRQQLLPRRGVAELQPEDDIFAQGEIASSSKLQKNEMRSVYTLRLPGYGETALYPNLSNKQLPSPGRSEIDKNDEEMSWRLDTAEMARLSNIRTGNKIRPTEIDQNFEGSTIAREEEEYRLERAAVKREIEEANASQVIVISSDSEGEEDNHGKYDIDDIWKEQAHISELPSQPKPNAPISPQLQNLKPRRSQIPSAWRRHSQNSHVRQGAADDTDLFWQPSQTSNSSETHEELSDESLYPDLRHQSPLDSAKDQDDRLSKDAINDQKVGSSTNKARVEVVIDQGCKLAVKSQVLQLPQRATVASKSVNVVSPTKNTMDNGSPVQNQAPTSWLGYLTSFVPAFRESIPLVAPTAEHRLPNGKRKLPHAGSLEGPLSLFTPWTEPHFRALYFHYAALIECRRRYVFNPESTSARYADRMIEHRGWERAITKDDCAIVDAFMIDLNTRGSLLEECVKGERRINESLVTKMVFILWMGGVKRGECEVRTGKTGLADGSDEVMWKPELESWFKVVAKQRSRK